MSAPATSTLITPKGILSYPNLFTPRPKKNAKPGDKDRYGCMIVFPKDSDLAAIKKAALDCAIEKIGRDKVVALLKDKKLNIGIREDLASKGWDTDVYTHFVQPWTTVQPGIVDRFRGSDGKALPIRDPNIIYAGCWVRASIRPVYYDQEGNKGIFWGLNNIQKVGEGERIDGRKAAADEFEAFEDAPADMPAPSGAAPTGTAAPPSVGASSADELAAMLG